MEEVSTPLRPDNIISQKILDILSTSYTDSSIREALLSLDERIEDNTVEARRELRSNTEEEVIKSNGLILKDFSRLSTKLSSIGDTINELNGLYKSMDQLVSHAHRSTTQIIKESTDLRAQDEKIEGKQVLLDAFHSTFVVSTEEAESLTSPGLLVDNADEEAFFKALEKVKRVHEDCQVLMASSTSGSTVGSQETGVEIMSQMSGYLDKAYDKLFHSVQHELKALSGQYIQIRKSLRKKLNVLAERPTLFESAMNGLCEARQKNLSHEFIKALTTTGNENNSKPIDMYAYDALRYIGDIMAWIHSAAVNERENLDALFETDTMVTGLKQGQESEPWSQIINAKSTVDTQVDKITGALVKPLRTRVEQVLASEPKATTIYQALNVLDFYRSTFGKHFPEKSQVMAALGKLQEACMRQFTSRLEDRIRSVKDRIEPPSSDDLQPPDYLIQALADLKTCLTSYETSIEYSPSGDDSIRQVVEDLVEPYLECCNRAAGDMTQLGWSGDPEIFLINCYDSAKMTLSLYSLTGYKVDQLESRIQELAEVLEDRQYRSFLGSSGVNKFGNADEKLRDRDSVMELSRQLDDFLPAATMESGMVLNKLSSPRLASTITLRASQRFADEFATIESKVREIYVDLSAEELKLLFPRSLDEVRVLLAID